MLDVHNRLQRTAHKVRRPLNRDVPQFPVRPIEGNPRAREPQVVDVGDFFWVLTGFPAKTTGGLSDDGALSTPRHSHTTCLSFKKTTCPQTAGCAGAEKDFQNPFPQVFKMPHLTPAPDATHASPSAPCR